MAYLTLSDPTTDSCDFKVKLSNPFNTDYYRRLRITKNNYGNSTFSINSYLENRTAGSSSSNYVRGVVNEGLSAGRTYTLYAYAQAANGTWYLAGSDDITMEDDASKEVDLGIKKIYYKYQDSDDDYELAEDDTIFETGKEIKFKVEVKNYTDVREPDYTVSVYDEDGNRLARDTGETPASKYNINNAYLYGITRNSAGKQTLKFAIILEDSSWTDTDNNDNTRYRTFEWKSKKPSKPQIISRAEWGAGEPNASGTNNPTQIIVHHTGDQNDAIANLFPNDDKGFMLREYEIAVGGVFSDFPYNWAIGLNDTILEGRDPSKQGGHEPKVNTTSLSVVVLGNYEIRDFETEQENNLVDLLAYLCYEYDISASQIKGHKDIKPKACPGKNVYDRLPYIRTKVASRL
jgi:N-acetylmuramoyl-L-alanine amidase